MGSYYSTRLVGADYSAPVTPSTHGFLAWTFDPVFCDGTRALTSQTVYATRIAVPVTTTFSNIVTFCESGGSVFTDMRLAVYDSSANLLVQSADVQSSFGGSGTKTIAVSSTTVVGGPSVYVFGVVWANAGTPPTLRRRGAGTQALINVGLSGANVRCGTMAGQTSLPASLTLTVGLDPMWMALS